MTEKAHDAAIAMVATSTQRLPSRQTILQALRYHVGDGVVPRAVEWNDSDLVFPVAGASIAISMMPPIPWSQLEGPCATAFWWPQATAVMWQHKFHCLVAIIGGPFSAVEKRVVLTHLVRGVAITTDAVGIYWGEGTLVHEPKSFIEESATVATDNLNLSLWLDVRVERNSDGTFRCFTTGMTRLGHMEIEVERTKRSPDELWGFIGDTAAYMVQQNVHLKDKETVGPSATERYTVRHKPSMFDRGTVLKILMT